MLTPAVNMAASRLHVNHRDHVRRRVFLFWHGPLKTWISPPPSETFTSIARAAGAARSRAMRQRARAGIEDRYRDSDAIVGFYPPVFRAPTSEPGVHLSICTGLSTGIDTNAGRISHAARYR